MDGSRICLLSHCGPHQKLDGATATWEKKKHPWTSFPRMHDGISTLEKPLAEANNRSPLSHAEPPLNFWLNDSE
jgi:hypothetical protein